jgi:NAD(P)-dependent dehydrogenase (short-subunit alcohol dehydrogenase family)
LNALAAELGKAHVIAVDLAKPKSAADLLKEIRSRGLWVRTLINNAGFSEHPTLAKTDPAAWAFDVNGNLNGAYNCAHAVIEGMKERGGGSIIAIGSVNGLMGFGDPAYSAAKAGMISLTKSLAMEYGRYNIRANIVLPGTVRTPLWERKAGADTTTLERLRKWYPLGRIVEPLDVARAVAFLASDAAAAITGTSLVVDCGLTAGNIVMTRELTIQDI